MLDFDSVADLEEFLKNPLEHENAKHFEQPIEYKSPLENATSSEVELQAERNGSKAMCTECTPIYVFPVISVWADYQYTSSGSGNSMTFSSINDISSYDPNVTTSWNESTTPTSTLNGNGRTADITIQGQHVLGINLPGFPIGLTYSATYTNTVTAGNDYDSIP